MVAAGTTSCQGMGITLLAGGAVSERNGAGGIGETDAGSPAILPVGGRTGYRCGHGGVRRLWPRGRPVDHYAAIHRDHQIIRWLPLLIPPPAPLMVVTASPTEAPA
jgi:hypothetical protein